MLVFLIGFMGSGKTTLGRSLAEEMNLNFYDTDELIEKVMEKTVSEIFEVFGEAYFRLSEHEILKILNPEEDAIIATGGGLPVSQANMDFLKTNGMVIFLDCSEDILLNRLEKDKAKRPATKDLNDRELKSFIRTKLRERRHHYEKAHMVYKVQNEDNAALKELKNYLSMFL